MYFAIPDSAKDVLEALVEKDGVSSRSIAEKINMPDRTVRYALKILKSKDFVRMRIILGDTRKRIYTLNKEILEDTV
ncbi:MAG: helix-turn-helix transcriptional regulator [Methanomicrobia archaeon]|nr:helix-turn-helix transcriptional regulator [Methanomicrobia archaeon]MCK4636259.1 helix-turn-helix transcriptional regulator [Methanomicrobia archaeon]